jgi:hypothetical protein
MDTSKPNIARVYDYWLGGKDNYAADRDVADRMLAHDPGLRDRVRDNREFVAGVARLAAERGIAQFIDLGAGLPTRPSVHEAARAVNPGARVAYVDNDPVVVSHARALLATGAGLAVSQADLRDPAAVLDDPVLHGVIDLAQPVCVILAAVAHFLPAAQAARITAEFTRPLAGRVISGDLRRALHRRGTAGQAVRAAHDGTVPEPRHRAAGRVPGRA